MIGLCLVPERRTPPPPEPERRKRSREESMLNVGLWTVILLAAAMFAAGFVNSVVEAWR